MTREEEIAKAAMEYENSTDDFKDNEIRDFFKRGAEWADAHPQKGLISIEKAYEWWKDEFSYPSMSQIEIIWLEDKIDSFKKAMEEQK